MVNRPSPNHRLSALLKQHSRWLSSRGALGVVAGCFVVAFLLGGWASLERTAANSDVARQGWVSLAKARLDSVHALSLLDIDLESGAAKTDAIASFEARRAAIGESLAGLETGDASLTLAIRSLQQSLATVPTTGDPSVDLLQVTIGQAAADIAHASSATALTGDLAFADRVAGDLGRVIVVDRLVSSATGSHADDSSYALSMATSLSGRLGGDSWRFGQVTTSDEVPDSVQGQVSTLTMSTEARTVSDAAVWAEALLASGGTEPAGSAPDAAAVDAASVSLTTQALDLATNEISRQAGALARGEEDSRAMAVRLVYGIGISVAIGCALIIARRQRSRMSDDELRAAASTDRLTGLGNRAHLDAEVALLGERSPEVVLMHIDLDHFKPVNDTYGHAVGDRVLQLSAERLREVADAHEGIAARLGGDEFVLVLPAIEQQVVDQVTTSLLQALQTFRIGGLDLTVGASIGVARGQAGVTDLLINADLALYQAKRTGRGQASTFRAEAAAFVSFVRDALIEGRVQVVYQPQVSLRDGRCFGAEVLARLVDESGSLIPAKDWLGIAEWLGVTGELFEHVVSAVCEDVRTGPPVTTRLWFNVAPNDLIRPGGTDWVLSQLARLKLPVRMIGLELTETEAITDPERLAVVLERLKEVGIGLALDDFGARNTPIGHLVDLPVTRVKLDASLVAGIGEDMPPSSWVVRAMAELATRLRIEVMAEGVTSGHQVALLAKLGVPGAQGYLLGLPGPLDRLPSAVNIRSLLQTSLEGFDAAAPVGPLVQMSGNRAAHVTERDFVARSGEERRRGLTR